MKINTKSRYAIVAIVDMALHADHGPVSLRDISIRQNVPLKYLEQIFSKLRKEGVVSSVRGPGGGYLLTKPLNEIMLSEVVLAVDGSFKMTRCTAEFKCSPLKGACVTHSLWKGLGKTIFSYFDSISVEDVLKDKINVNMQESL
jgi:Rrf2 family iron-sulfur cluster assembly transcriptional regulator